MALYFECRIQIVFAHWEELLIRYKKYCTASPVPVELQLQIVEYQVSLLNACQDIFSIHKNFHIELMRNLAFSLDCSIAIRWTDGYYNVTVINEIKLVTKCIGETCRKLPLYFG